MQQQANLSENSNCCNIVYFCVPILDPPSLQSSHRVTEATREDNEQRHARQRALRGLSRDMVSLKANANGLETSFTTMRRKHGMGQE